MVHNHAARRLVVLLASFILVSCTVQIKQPAKDDNYPNNDVGQKSLRNRFRKSILQIIQPNPSTKYVECRGSLREGSVIFHSSHYPKEQTRAGICILDIVPSNNTCGIRISPIDLHLQKPVVDVCDDQSLVISGPGLQGGGGSYPICGQLSDRVYNVPLTTVPGGSKAVTVAVIYQPPLAFKMAVATISCSVLHAMKSGSACGLRLHRNAAERRLRSRKKEKEKFINTTLVSRDYKWKQTNRLSYFHKSFKSTSTQLKIKRGDRFRIIRGDPATPGDWPWMVAIEENGNVVCGGSLITPAFVLTAQHCIEYVSAKDLLVSLAEYDFDTASESPAVKVAVDKILPHYRYDWYSIDSDVSLLQLREKVKLSQYINTICLPFPYEGEDPKGALKSIGWGVTETGHGSTYLQEIDMHIVQPETCLMKWSRVGEVRPGEQVITENMICASANMRDSGICSGDSGGPLMTKGRRGAWLLSGVVSFSKKCASGTPDIFTRVSSFLRWITLGISENTI